MGGVEHRTISEAEAGLRLDKWFARHYPDLPYGRLAKLLRTGQIRLDGGRVKPGHRLVAGQDLRIPPLDAGARTGKGPAARTERVLSADEKARARAMVIYRDQRILALDKEPGLPSQGGPGQKMHVDRLLDALRFGKRERPRLVHRLDKDTSGVLLVARDRATAGALTRAFRARSAEKIYWALVVGVPKERRGRIDLPIEKRPGRGGEKMEAAAGGKSAITDYAIVATAGRKAAWLALRPVTGRTHQLRVHLAAIGHPVVGDGKYGGKEAFLSGAISKKLHLHARAIRLPGLGPEGGRLEISAPLPAHMAASFDFLGFEEKEAAEAEAALMERF